MLNLNQQIQMLNKVELAGIKKIKWNHKEKRESGCNVLKIDT